ncbi:GTP-binding protein [Flavicella sediminum]|uniref:GTP-binding protein n=1 Tax=Flavicella sediminum TaxID=2585141 RepID=UPI00111DA8ED|nr:GTP-binding protein [Flavicella sediminum]
MDVTQNNPIYLRPRFQIELEENRELLLNKFSEAINRDDCRVRAKIVDAHIVLDVLKEEDHFWSPQLHIEIEAIDSKRSLLKGLFGPKPQVWTLFMFLHFALAITFIGFLITAYVQWTLGNSYTLPLIIETTIPISWLALYVAGRMGKKTGYSQMQQLHNFMEDVLES